MGEKFVCPICKNEDPRYIGYKNGKPYCRRCITFNGEEASNTYKISKNVYIKKNYELTSEQKRISNEILVNFQDKRNQLIYAVCGAGKTELVFGVIKYAISKNMRVGFAIPRKDVVIELVTRFKFTFPSANVVSLYGGNTNVKEGDLVILTTHQLYRFVDYFDLLIMDEIDAFPYYNNDLLLEMFKRSVRGNYIMMSATPSELIMEEFKNKEQNKLVSLFTRHHMEPIPVPVIKIIPTLILKILFIIKKLKTYEKQNKPCLIFVPTIELSQKLYIFLKNFVKRGFFVNSHSKTRSEIIDKFRSGEFIYLVTTAVLERGVTLRNLQVIIFNADSKIYDRASLVQISGRVGRVVGATKGDCIFICDTKTKGMVEAIHKIDEANKHLQELL